MKTNKITNKSKTIGSLVALGLMMSTLSALATVDMVNPGFEDPILDPWQTQDTGAVIAINTDTNLVRTGSQSAQVSVPAADYRGIKQVLLITDPADRLGKYKVTFYVLPTGVTNTIGVRASLWEFGSGITFNDGPWVWIPGGTTNWVEISATIETSRADAGTFWAVLSTAPQGDPKPEATFWVDDASIVRVDPPPSGDLTWVGGLSGNAWDFTTTNWLDSVSSVPSLFTDGQLARFTDAGAANANVQLVGTLMPSKAIFSAATNFSFGGAGKLSGQTELNMTGTGTLTVSNTSNDYTNKTAIDSGTFKLGASEVIPDGVGKGDLRLNGTLDLNGFNETVNSPVGNGQVTNSSATASTLTLNFLVDTSYSGPITSEGAAVTLVKTGPGMWVRNAANAFVGQTIIKGGRILLQNGDFFGSSTVTISNNAYLMMWNINGLVTNDFHLYSLGGLQGGQTKEAIRMDGGNAGAITDLSGTVHLEATANLGAYDTQQLTVSGKVTGPGGLWKSAPGGIESGGTLLLNNSANDFSGGLSVYRGKVQLGANGAGGSGNVLVSSNATLQLDASAALATNSIVSLVDTSSVVNLNFAGTQNILKLSFDGGATFTAPGTWGAPGSGAANQDARFTGNGLLNVAQGSLPPQPPQPSIQVSVSGTDLELTVLSVSGFSYQLWGATNLTPPVDWTAISTNSGTGGTLTNVVPIVPTTPQAYYRYLVQ